MKNLSSARYLPVFFLLGGLTGALLRLLQYSLGMDADGLLRFGHPAGILTLLLSAAAIVLALRLTHSLSLDGKYTRQYPPSRAGAVGALAGSAALLLSAMVETVRQENSFSLIIGLAGLAAAVALAFTGLCRWKGLRPHLCFHTILCLYFALRLLHRYRSWSSDPQLFDYVFQLLAIVCAMLFSYHRAALDYHAENRRRLVIFGLLGGYFSCLSLVAADTPLFYAGIAAWMLTNLGTFTDATPSREAME